MSLRPPALTRLFFLLLPIGISLAVAAALVIAVGRDPLDVVDALWQGAFKDSRKLGGVFNFWIPLSLVSIGLVVTFRAGLWNIGVEGQMMMGALFASWGAQYLLLDERLAPLLHVLLLCLAALGGMVWAWLVGALKIRLGVNEIFGGVALNALVNVISIYLISGPWQPRIGGSAQGTAPFPKPALLPEFAPTFPVNIFMIALVAAAFFIIYVLLNHTRWGLNLKAVGKNMRSAQLLGVATQRTSMSAFLVCGALAGVAGSYRVLFTFDNLRPLASGGIGFLGLLVVLLLSIRLLWVPLVAFAFAAILTGSTRLQIAPSLKLDSSLAGVMQGMLVLFVILFQGLRETLFPVPNSSPSPPSQGEESPRQPGRLPPGDGEAEQS
ncbi:MAG: ABC transporter permease [Chloroflexi bacterium]|nr:ABC transporter permease [Chloroflexota bacterium]MCY4245996.1 ABC transporter permease [Chloroflexota bacterium]